MSNDLGTNMQQLQVATKKILATSINLKHKFIVISLNINCESVCLYKYSDEKIARVLGHVLMAFTITVMTTIQADQIPGRY